MPRKIIIAVMAAVLVVVIALFAAEKAKEKSPADKPRQDVKAFGEPKQKEGLLDQLIAAYQANDREKMGEIIKKMAQRRDEMQKLAKLNKWHQETHRKWAMAGWGANPELGRDGAMAGPPREWQAGPGWNRGYAGNLPAGRMEGRGGPACGRGLAEGGQQWGNAPCQTPARRGCCCGRMGGCGAMNGGPGQMRGWDGPACPRKSLSGERSQRDDWAAPGWRHRQMRDGGGCGQGQGWEPGPGPEQRNMPPDNVPPVDWGW